MVKTKHKKSTKPPPPPPPPRAKKHGKRKDDSREMQAQLDGLGLKLIEVTGDGNCFFRALADQLDGNECEHAKYRNMVVQFIMINRDMFEPFIEDEEPFDAYCQSMQSDGTWAGHMELQAASLVTQCNICIHQHMTPRWYILNFGKHEARMIHLSYHDGQHYNSVRSKDDACTGPAKPILIKADADVSATSQGKSASVNSNASGRNNSQQGSIKMVMAGSGCEDVEKINKVLEQVGGDVDAAIEYLIAEQLSWEDFDGNTTIRPPPNSMNGDIHEKMYEKPEIDSDYNRVELVEHKASRKEKSQEKKRVLHEEKKISRNSMCPCGSKKKHKSCCGSVAGRSSTKLKISGTTSGGGNGKNEKKLSKKGGTTNASKDNQSEIDSINMGALCI